MDNNRKLIFISHANHPKDNDFTLWLASRLTTLGYIVWSDLTRLFGAEIFWDDIEKAIRQHAAKTIIVLSHLAQSREAVQDEIHLAISVERDQHLERFVVPVIIDDLPINDIKLILARKTIINFHNSWPDGLKQLMKVLERDSVPKTLTLSAYQTNAWLQSLMQGNPSVIDKPQTLIGNWFKFDFFPESLNFYRLPIPNNKINTQLEDFQYPWFLYQDMMVTFASLNDVDDFLPPWMSPTTAYQISLETYLAGEGPKALSIDRQTAINHISYLTRDAWNRSMKTRNMLYYELANKGVAWYFPKDRFFKVWAYFFNMAGEYRKRYLVGYSKVRNVYWNFAMQAQPVFGRIDRIVLKPHVIFTTDGVKPIGSDKRMHRLRRGFCRNWWNSHWRDLMLAYTAQLLDHNTSIDLLVGSNTAIQIHARPLIFESPLSISELEVDSSSLIESDTELDESADEFEWIEEDELEEDIIETEQPESSEE